ncbi:ankyrin repeat-containing domain protein [Mycena rosella]|uniref:Ankyrin repeat-containing domain protein n=1 Tax=Mycena rosella TaxID=1033263 RepID=A0AAD7GF67_MYCRO|nr:ankyrin repeat-containing domain protein [Mycena rosella]
MAATLGTITAILQLVDTALKAREYVKDFHDAPKEQRKLFSEMEDLRSLLGELNKRAAASPSGEGLQKMSPPLSAFKATMEKFTATLGPVEGLSKFTKRLTWTLWSKKEAVGYLEELERMKGLITLWLTMDIWDVGQKQIANQDSILNAVQEHRDHIDAEKRRAILDWISPLNFLQRQADIFSTLQPGTGEWLLAEAQFQDWKSGAEQVLWCRGIPGAGKTVLASLVVNHLETRARNENLGLACIYLNHKETDTQTIPNLLGGLLKQLILGTPIPSEVNSLYAHHSSRQTRPAPDEFRKALNSALVGYPQVYFIIDALDEYPEHPRHLFLKHLATLVPQIKILLTSRPHINLDSYFPNLKIIEIQAAEEDIHRYLDTQIENSVRLSKHIRTRPELAGEIQAKITGNAKGMFLLAKLHIESLAAKNTIKAVKEALQHLPKDLDHTYDEALERINRQNEEDKQLGLLALTWVANVKRPLSVSELREALAIEPEDTYLDVDNLLDMDIVLSVCAGLIIVDETVSIIRLIHYTTQDYLDSIQSHTFPTAHTTIVSTCLTYMSFEEFKDLPRSREEGEVLVSAHPFLGYAQYCLMHASGQPEIHLQDKIISFLVQVSTWAISGIFWCDAIPWVDIAQSFAPLCIASACNLQKIVRYLLPQGIPSVVKNTAFCTASSYGHIQIVQLLVDEGANIHFRGPWGNALQVASRNGHKSVVQLLIEKGAKINVPAQDSEIALKEALRNGHWHVAELLIESGADVNGRENSFYRNVKGDNWEHALTIASRAGHKSIVQLILKHGDVDAENYAYALQGASMGGHKPVVELLLEIGGAASAEHYSSALNLASKDGNVELVCLLINKGADVNGQGGWFGNALQAASWNGQELVVRLLIDKGANVHAQGKAFGSALQAASANGHERIVQLLIEKGANVNGQGGRFGSALQLALTRGYKAVAQLLVENGAYDNSRDANEAVTQPLTEDGADTNVARSYDPIYLPGLKIGNVNRSASRRKIVGTSKCTAAYVGKASGEERKVKPP